MEEKHNDVETLARECYTEAIVGSRTSIPGNINAIIALLDAHCTLFLSLQQKEPGQKSVEDCLRTWRIELAKSFELKYDPQLHRAWLDSYRILLRYKCPLAQEIENVVLRDPQGSSDVREVVIKLIQLHLLKSDDENALELANSHLDKIRDYDSLSILPVLNSRYLNGGLTATKAFAFAMLDQQQPHPVASALNWKVLTLLGEHEKAKQEAIEFRDFCLTRPQDPRAMVLCLQQSGW